MIQICRCIGTSQVSNGPSDIHGAYVLHPDEGADSSVGDHINTLVSKGHY